MDEYDAGFLAGLKTAKKILQDWTTEFEQDLMAKMERKRDQKRKEDTVCVD